jgi:hypothetical protein
MQLMQIAVLVFASVSFGGEPTMPEVGPLDGRYRHQPHQIDKDHMDAGWSMENPQLVGNFIIVSLREHVALKSVKGRFYDTSKTGGMDRLPVLVSINLLSGKASQFVTHPFNPADGVRRAISRYWGLPNNRCMVTIRDVRLSKQLQWQEIESRAWEWDLDRNCLADKGSWNAARLLSTVLDTSQIDVKLSPTSGDAQLVELQDRKTMRSTSLQLRSPVFLDRVPAQGVYEFVDGDTIIPQSDRVSIVTFEPQVPLDFNCEWATGLECHDPRTRRGLSRWSLRASDIKKVTGTNPAEVRPIRGLLQSQPYIGVYVPGFGEDGYTHYLLRIDEATGTPSGKVELPYDIPWHIPDLMLSPDGEHIAYMINRDDPNEATGDDAGGSKQKVPLSELVVVRFADGSVSSRTDLSDCCTDYDWIFASDFQKSALVFNDNQIRRISIGKANSCEDIFTLEP